jgi:cell division protein FtsX
MGGILLFAGAEKAMNASAWGTYAVFAAGGFVAPLVYTAYLARRRRLFLHGAKAIEENRAAIARGQGRVWLVTIVVTALGVAFGSVETVFYAGLGGASIGFWPGLAANFLRLWREEWSRN